MKVFSTEAVHTGPLRSAVGWRLLVLCCCAAVAGTAAPAQLAGRRCPKVRVWAQVPALKKQAQVPEVRVTTEDANTRVFHLKVFYLKAPLSLHWNLFLQK